MLMLGVDVGDYVMIGDDIKVRVVKTGDVFRLGIEAPREMTILRKKLFENSTGHTEEAYPESDYGKRHPSRKVK